MEVVELSAADTGLIILIGQIVDALTSIISGYLGDMVKVPVLSQKIGMRKSWHLKATVFMGIVVPLWGKRCILCSGNHQTWLPTDYYGFLYSLYNMCFSVMEINHLAFITTSAVSVEELTDLSAISTSRGLLLEQDSSLQPSSTLVQRNLKKKAPGIVIEEFGAEDASKSMDMYFGVLLKRPSLFVLKLHI
ncbi:hypothetical protein pdam_00019323 [Pocillopora damicornis]|uniref:Uncharacterized protein n=1 Tax=Pocillopora damicornis TaxID=46731 RepID=A0A3M6U1C3_POCDA|nr:hypothetical protein pdam_00019323 [Pocillopora damicornis]